MLDFKTSPDRRTLSDFRTHLILTCLTVTGVFVAIIALSVFVPLAAHLNRAEIGEAAAAGLADHFIFLHKALWPLVALSLVACVVSAMILYQRMRAPLVRFVRCFDTIGNGAVPETLTIRLGDYLTQEADALNRMVDRLAAMNTERRQAAERIDVLMEELSSREVDPILIEDLSAAVKVALHPSGPSVEDAS